MTQIDELKAELRAVRRRYDQLERGKTASIRRARSAAEVALDRSYWQVGEAVARAHHNLPHVVLLFPLAPQSSSLGFSFGRFLRRELGDGDGAALRFRRLLDSRDREELDHRLRAVLRLASADRAPVDWGTLGVEVLWFFAESDNVRRRWAQDFYAPISPSPDARRVAATNT